MTDKFTLNNNSIIKKMIQNIYKIRRRCWVIKYLNTKETMIMVHTFRKTKDNLQTIAYDRPLKQKRFYSNNCIFRKNGYEMNIF